MEKRAFLLGKSSIYIIINLADLISRIDRDIGLFSLGDLGESRHARCIALFRETYRVSNTKVPDDYHVWRSRPFVKSSTPTSTAIMDAIDSRKYVDLPVTTFGLADACVTIASRTGGGDDPEASFRTTQCG